jgi:hypothetical protein
MQVASKRRIVMSSDNRITNQADDDLALLNHLVDGEDEFDVDLMACGCRLATAGKFNFDVADIIRLFELDDAAKNELIAVLVDESKIGGERLLQLAEKVSSRKLLSKK